MLVSEDGKIITAAHVVEADNVKVKFGNGDVYNAKVIPAESAADLALIQLDTVPDDIVVAKIGDSDEMQVGDEIFVIGAPYGISHTLTTGHISGHQLPNVISGELGLVEFLQTDAAINEGN